MAEWVVLMDRPNLLYLYSYILHMLSIFLTIGHLFVSVDWFHLSKCNSYYNTRISA